MVGTTVGYAGGTTVQPSYSAMGDHSETLRIEYDPAVIDYSELLEVFWQLHDPTAEPYLRQYRNAVFYLDPEQKAQAEASATHLSERSGRKVNSAIEPAGAFTAAEDYHQKHYLRRADKLMRGLQKGYADEAEMIASTDAARVNGFLGCHGEPQTLPEQVAALDLPHELQLELLEYLTLRCREFKGVPCALPAR